MIVQKKTPPQDGPRVIGNALADLAGHSDMSTLGGAPLNLAQPLPVYRLNLSDIHDEKFLDTAEHVGWRYLVENAAGATAGGANVGFADLVQTKDGKTSFASFSRNRNAEVLMEAAHLAEDIAKQHDTEYHARILDIPALYLAALWLKGPDSIFIPYIDHQRLADPTAKVEPKPNFIKDVIAAAELARSHLSPDAGPAMAP